jgi:hypothetical protein
VRSGRWRRWRRRLGRGRGPTLRRQPHGHRRWRPGPAGDRRQACGGRLAVAQAGRVVGERRRERLEAGPEVRAVRVGDRVLRRVRQAHEVLDRVAAAILGQQRVEGRAVLVPSRRPVVGDVVGDLVDREPVDRRPRRRGLQRERTARGDAVEVRRSADRRDQRVDVLDLSLDRIRQGVAAPAAAAPRVVDDGEVLGQLGNERGVLGAVVDPSADQDHGGAASRALVGDRRAVLRGDVRHRSLSRPRPARGSRGPAACPGRDRPSRR